MKRSGLEILVSFGEITRHALLNQSLLQFLDSFGMRKHVFCPISWAGSILGDRAIVGKTPCFDASMSW